MKYAIVLAAAAWAAPVPVSAAASAPAGLGAAFPVACAAGYHADAGGNCQSNAGELNRYCPPGTVFHPTFEGWTCDPPPPEAY